MKRKSILPWHVQAVDDFANGLDWSDSIGSGVVDRNWCDRSGQCRARSDCTYVQADLALECLQNKSRSRTAG